MPKRPKQIKWTTTLDAALREAVEEYGNDWPTITEVIGHYSTEAVRVRYMTGVRDGRWPPARDRHERTKPDALREPIADMFRRGLKRSEITKTLQRQGYVSVTDSTVARVIARLQADGEIPRRIVRASVAPKWTPSSSDGPAAVWERVEAVTSRDLVKHSTQGDATVTIDSDRPIGIAVISDQHIRLSGPVDLKRMREDAEIVASTDGLFAIMGGDGVDNHIKHHAAMVHGGTEPGEEWRLFDHYLGMFDDKILAVVSGNHDDWTSDFSGVSKVKDLAVGRRLFFAPDEVVLRTTVGATTYTICVRHQYRFNSTLNQVHTVKQLWTHGNTQFDIGVVCHHHVPALEPFVRHGKVVWGARPGSYQMTSTFARRYGYARHFPTCPTFLLWPNERQILGFLDVRQAADYLTWLRGRDDAAA